MPEQPSYRCLRFTQGNHHESETAWGVYRRGRKRQFLPCRRDHLSDSIDGQPAHILPGKRVWTQVIGSNRERSISHRGGKTAIGACPAGGGGSSKHPPGPEPLSGTWGRCTEDRRQQHPGLLHDSALCPVLSQAASRRGHFPYPGRQPRNPWPAQKWRGGIRPRRHPLRRKDSSLHAPLPG